MARPYSLSGPVTTDIGITIRNVARFLDRYGFRFADFDGCMYGLVATHGKDAGLPIKKPWRVAFVNSSLGLSE